MDDLCEQLFSRTWSSLDVEAIEDFVSGAQEEGLTWEATGGQKSRHKVRKEVCAFANSERGGYLLLGVEGNVKRGWRVEGLDFEATEPAQWVGQVISSGLRPRLAFDTRPFDVADGRVLVVVQVPPVSEPPCITSGGAIYERVTGESVPVKDPARLAELFAAGKAARVRAEAGATGAAQDLITSPPLAPTWTPTFRIAFGVRATGYPADIGGRLFTTAFDRALQRAMTEHLLPGAWPPVRYRQDRTVTQTTFTSEWNEQIAWSIEGRWDGSIGAYYTDSIFDRTVDDVVNGLVKVAWQASLGLVRELGGSAPIHISIRLASNTTITDGPAHAVHLQREAGVEYPSKDDLDRVRRELLRAGGQQAHEPATQENR